MAKKYQRDGMFLNEIIESLKSRSKDHEDEGEYEFE